MPKRAQWLSPENDIDEVSDSPQAAARDGVYHKACLLRMALGTSSYGRDRQEAGSGQGDSLSFDAGSPRSRTALGVPQVGPRWPDLSVPSRPSVIGCGPPCKGYNIR